jgi:DNA polymerase-3 subunit epsilon
MVRNAPTFEIVKKEVQKIINSYSAGITAFNNRFDFSFLESRGIEFPKKLACPMLLLTEIMKLPKNNGYSGYKWPSVEEAFKYFFPETQYIEKHRGADDAKHEAMIVYELYKMGIFII